MKIGIVGASGTLGRVTVASLLEQNPKALICALVRRPDAELSAMDRCHLLEGGIFDTSALDELARSSDVIVNLAARNPEGQERDLESLQEFLSANGLGAALVARAAAKYDTPLLHFSTVAVYETGAYRAGAYLEEHETLPAGDYAVVEYFKKAVKELTAKVPAEESDAGVMEAWLKFCSNESYPNQAPVYGLTKLIGEQSVLNLIDKVICVRMCDVFGPGHESRGVITDHLSALRLKNHVQVNFDFRKTVSYIYIQDVVDFIGMATSSLVGGVEIPKVLNLVGDAIDEDGFYVELVNLSAVVGAGFNVSAAAARADSRDRRYSRERFRQSYPLVSETTLAKGLELTWRAT